MQAGRCDVQMLLRQHNRNVLYNLSQLGWRFAFISGYVRHTSKAPEYTP